MGETESAVQQEVEKTMEQFPNLSSDAKQLLRFGIGIGIEIAARVQDQKVDQ